MTRITLENEHGKYIVEIKKESITLESVMDDLIQPVLLAAGYHESTIENYFCKT